MLTFCVDWIFGNKFKVCRKSIDIFDVLLYIIIIGLSAKYQKLAESMEVIVLDTTVKEFITKHPAFTTSEFADMLRIECPNIGRSTIYYLLKTLCNTGVITRTSRGHFDSAGKKDYFYELSDIAKKISLIIREQYPLINFQIWELYQMNEFVNHLLTRNTIFIEVEDMLDESIFNLLFEKYPHVLHNPSMNEYYKYAGNETIIVRKLISEAPSCFGKYRQAALEKLLVDLFGRGISGSIISRSEYQAIYEDSFKKYNINPAKMFRYARRRGIEQTIQDFIHEETNIVLGDNK